MRLGCRRRGGRVEGAINVLAQVPSPWVPHPPTFLDDTHQELSNFATDVASEVVREHYSETDT